MCAFVMCVPSPMPHGELFSCSRASVRAGFTKPFKLPSTGSPFPTLGRLSLRTPPPGFRYGQTEPKSRVKPSLRGPPLLPGTHAERAHIHAPGFLLFFLTIYFTQWKLLAGLVVMVDGGWDYFSSVFSIKYLFEATVYSLRLFSSIRHAIFYLDVNSCNLTRVRSCLVVAEEIILLWWRTKCGETRMESVYSGHRRKF